MKKQPLPYFSCAFLLLIIMALISCQEQMYEPNPDESLILKRGGQGGKSPADVEQGDLYGDLLEEERTFAGVPVLYPLKYRADFQDQIVEGIIDVPNPRLNGPFELTIYVRDEFGYVVMDAPPGGGDPVPRTATVMIYPGDDGFLNDEGEFSPVVLYDMEGEILEDVVPHVFPVEQGRLNLIRTNDGVITNRMAEVIKNFGDGTVADVIRDFCGRLFMVRTQEALNLGIADKPIDSPLENLAIYYELMINGFSQSAIDNGLLFLIEQEGDFGGFRFQSRLDSRWSEGAQEFGGLLTDEEKQYFVANLTASCIAAGSDKTDFLIIDEIVLVNRFMGIPKAIGNDIDKPADQVISFFPYIEQEVRMMDKTDKHQYVKYRYYVDYSFFNYTRQKFEETLIDYCTIVGDYDSLGNLVGSHVEVLAPNLTLNDILMGDAPLTAEALEIYRYTEKAEQQTSGALGFANQADDYVQALEVVHNNEEFLVWKVPTPTWAQNQVLFRGYAPFNYVPDEEVHSKKPEGKGDDESTDTGGGGSGGRRR